MAIKASSIKKLQSEEFTQQKNIDEKCENVKKTKCELKKKLLVNASVKTFQKNFFGIIWSRVLLWNYPISNSSYQVVTPSTPHPHDTQVILTKLILTEIIFYLYSFSYPASAKQFCLFCIEIDVFFKVDPMPDAKWKNLRRYVQGRSFWRGWTNPLAGRGMNWNRCQHHQASICFEFLLLHWHEWKSILTGLVGLDLWDGLWAVFPIIDPWPLGPIPPITVLQPIL